MSYVCAADVNHRAGVDGRRAFIAGVASFFVAAATANAQPAGKIERIGYLQAGPQAQLAHLIDVQVEALRQLGWIESQNLIVERRFADGKIERLPALAAELARLDVRLIFTPSNQGVAAVQQATRIIPVVMLAGNPVESGFIETFARPGGNVTGLTFDVGPEQWGKRLELLREVVPSVSRVALLTDTTFPGIPVSIEEAQRASQRLGIALRVFDVRQREDLEPAFAAIGRGGIEGIVVLGVPVIFGARGETIALAAKYRLPAIYNFREATIAGGLMSYSVDFRDLFRRSAAYIDKILRGAKAGSLPVERPTRLDLVVNVRTAKTLGLTIPPSVLVRADQMIDP